MTIDEMLALLQPWQDNARALDAAFDALEASVGLDPDSPLFSAAWRIHEQVTQHVAARIGAPVAALDWWQYENEWGANGMEAGFVGGASPQMRPMRTLREYAELLVAEKTQ